MPYRTANYSAFYVTEPFSTSNLGAYATSDFIYYNQLRAWKEKDASFPFVDAHDKTYNVRDDSLWDTLKSRLHERLDYSKNIILFLSNKTKNSDALREEIDYGINVKGLPVIVIYPEFKNTTDIVDATGIREEIKKLWNNLPVFRDSMKKVGTIHIPLQQRLIIQALQDPELTVQKMLKGCFYYKNA